MTQWRAERVEQLRNLVMSADGAMVEEVKWRKASNPDGVPTFSCDGLVCTIETYKDKVKVTLAKGASLPDPDGMFNASLDAGTRRAIDLFADDTVAEQAFVEIIRAAVELNRST